MELFILCGILLLGPKDLYPYQTIKDAQEKLKHRGPDNASINNFPYYWLSTTQLSIVGKNTLPVLDDGIIVTGNAEIYNYKDLWKIYFPNEPWDANFNDLQVVAKIFNQLKFTTANSSAAFQKVLELIRGVYSLFLVTKQNKLFIARDSLGIRPLFFAISPSKGWAFCSEKDLLLNLGFSTHEIRHVPPGSWTEFSVKSLVQNHFRSIQWFKSRPFLSLRSPDQNKNFTLIQDTMHNFLEKAVRIRIPDQKFGLFFSGGIDSAVLLAILRKLRITDVIPITVGFENSPDLEASRELCKIFDYELEEILLSKKILQNALPHVLKLLKSFKPTPIDISIALPIFLAAQRAKALGLKVCFTGQGADEIFFGYNKYFIPNNKQKSENINDLRQSDIKNIALQNIERDDKIAMYHSIELRFPYLDIPFLHQILTLPQKLHFTPEHRKILLRTIAKRFDLPPKFMYRKKKALQYGTHTMKHFKAQIMESFP